ncbi:MAG: hypothetical protein HY938_09595 [Nitrosomonadales bacterium]|nr:hypothetical protein [Nitrosomonadales bacterium]
MNNSNSDTHISVEQQRYATWLSWGSRSGLAILVATFLAYVFGWLPARIPLDQMPNVWSLPTSEYLHQTGAPTGWHWLTLIGQGDFAGLLGIAWLSGCSLLCLVVVMPIYARRRDWIFLAICIIALLVQLLAASGMLTVGH